MVLNLVANPDVEVKLIGTGEVRRLRARVTSPEEKESLWPTIVASYKGYAGYQKRTRRDIRGGHLRGEARRRLTRAGDRGIPHEVLPDS